MENEGDGKKKHTASSLPSEVSREKVRFSFSPEQTPCSRIVSEHCLALSHQDCESDAAYGTRNLVYGACTYSFQVNWVAEEWFSQRLAQRVKRENTKEEIGREQTVAEAVCLFPA